MIYIEDFIEKIRKILDNHRISEGEYSRWISQSDENKRELGANPYGCADAANILFTIGDFNRTVKDRKKWVENINKFQDKETGMFFESTHFPLHTTAHCLAALQLFDVDLRQDIKELEKYKTIDGLYSLLESVDWKDNPWNSSHIGAGIFAAMNLTGNASREWNEAYFKWLWDEADDETGLWRKGCIKGSGQRTYHHMAGTFHYLFNLEYMHMPMRYPDKLIDSCLKMYYDNDIDMGDRFFDVVSFIQIDFVYCISRAMRQTAHRFDECKSVLKEFADRFIPNMMKRDENDDELNDLHGLFGMLCCFAELQQVLPGYIISEKPLFLVLNRRPFI